MPRIPLDNYGQATVVPRPNTMRAPTVDSSGLSRGAQALAEGFGDVANAIAHQQAQEREEALAFARAQAANALLEDESQSKALAADIETRIADGSLNWRDAAEQYDEAQRDREQPTIPGLPRAEVERFNGLLRANKQTGRYAVQRAAGAARRTEFRGQFDSALDTLGKQAGEPGADIGKLLTRAEAFIPLAQAAGVDEATIAAKVQGFKDKAWENQAKARAIAGRNDPEALVQLEYDLTAEDGFYAGKLDTDKRNVLLNQVLGRKDQVERATRDAIDRAEAKADRALADFERQVASGVMAPTEAMQAWGLAVAGGTEAQRERFRELLDDEDELREVRKLPPADQQQYVQMLKAQEQANGATTTQIANRQRIEAVIEEDRRRLRESPLEHDALLKGGTAQPLDVAALASGDVAAIRGQLAERMTTLTRMRKQFGPEVGVVPLLPQEASTLASMLTRASPRQAAEMFGALSRAIDDPTVYAAAMQQVSPDSPVRAYAGRIYALQRAGGPPNGAITKQSRNSEFGDVAMYLLKGEAMLNPGKGERALDGKAVTFPMPPPQQFEQRVTAQLRTSFAGRPQDLEVAMQAVRAYYAAKAADEGDISGRLDGGRLNLAIRAVVGERTRYEGRDVVAPWGMSADEFRDKADDYVRERLRAAGLEDPGDVALLNLRGRDGAYQLVRGLDPLLDANGMPLLIRIGGAR